MKKNRKTNGYHEPKAAQGLLDRIHLVMEADLEDPIISKEALSLLSSARKAGVKFQNLASDCPECALCVFISLMTAAQNIEQMQKH